MVMVCVRSWSRGLTGHRSAEATTLERLAGSRGTSLVEYVMVVGLVALVAMTGARKFGAAISDKVERQGHRVTSLEGAESAALVAKADALVAGGVAPASALRSTALALAAHAVSLAAAPEAVPPPPPQPALPEISKDGQAQMAALLAVAKKRAGKKHPGGWCYRAVMAYIDKAGYAGFDKGSVRTTIPVSHQGYAHDFADWMDQVDANGVSNASKLGLQKLPIDDPYQAPAGSIVVVRAGTPGTRHPTAGDIAIASGDGVFYNDGRMGYGGSDNFPEGNDYVLGIYAPK